MARAWNGPAPELERVLLGPMRAALLQASLDTSLLTVLARPGRHGSEELARRARISRAGAELLLAGLKELGVLRCRGTVWSLTRLGRKELAGAAATQLRGALELTCGLHWGLFSMLHHAARKGAPVVPPRLALQAQRRRLAALGVLASAAVPLAARALRQRGAARDLRRWLDVGAGSGQLSFGLLRRFPRARAVLIDRPEIVRTSRRATPAGVAQRVRWRACDMQRQSWGRNFDAIVFSQLLSEAADLDGLFARASAALRPGGLLLVHDTFFGSRGFALALRALLMLMGPRPPRSTAEVAHSLRAHRFRVLRKLRPTRWTQLWVARRP